MDGEDVFGAFLFGLFLGLLAGCAVGFSVAEKTRPCVNWQERWDPAVAPADQIDLLADRPRGCPLPEGSP